jgi:CMP-N-acetylneuraminic acid synthetase
MKNKILCISTARKNSKSIKNKNLIKIKNIPLLYHNIYSALNVKKISNKKFDRIERPRN